MKGLLFIFAMFAMNEMKYKNKNEVFYYNQ